jgi:hypothetical protein
VRLRLNPVPWLRAHVVTLGALLFVCAQVGCTAISLAHFYFRQADFGILDRAAGSGFGWKYLMWLGGARDGHLMPIGLAIAWMLVRVSLYDWLLARAVAIFLVAAASLALLRLLGPTRASARPAPAWLAGCRSWRARS